MKRFLLSKADTALETMYPLTFFVLGGLVVFLLSLNNKERLPDEANLE